MVALAAVKIRHQFAVGDRLSLTVEVTELRDRDMYIVRVVKADGTLAGSETAMCGHELVHSHNAEDIV